MHLALFLSGLSGGGAQRRIISLARGIVNRGHEVDLVVANADGPFRAQLASSVRIVDLGNRWRALPGLRNRRGLWVPLSVWRLAAYLRAERPYALLSTSHPANLTAIWARRRARTGTPIVVSVNVHVTAACERQTMYGRLLHQLLYRFYPSADAVIAISNGVAEDLASAVGVPRERITKIYNPIELEAIQRQALQAPEPSWLDQKDVPIVLGVGKLEAQKDFATLIAAFARVHRLRPVRLAILGEGGQRADLLALARRLGVASDVAMPGFVHNPYAWMARAAVFVLSSAWEGFSNALVEALACGCPVVSTDCSSGPREILQDGAYGSLVPVGDERAIAAAIMHLLDRPPDKEPLRGRAASFSVDLAVERYLDVLRRVSGIEGEAISFA